MPSDYRNSSGPIEPAEVLTDAEYRARREQHETERRRRAEAAPEIPELAPQTAFGAIAGDVIARLVGGNPRIGRRIGALVADGKMTKERISAVASKLFARMQKTK